LAKRSTEQLWIQTFSELFLLQRKMRKVASLLASRSTASVVQYLTPIVKSMAPSGYVNFAILQIKLTNHQGYLLMKYVM
jgi:hypothetical protein